MNSKNPKKIAIAIANIASLLAIAILIYLLTSKIWFPGPITQITGISNLYWLTFAICTLFIPLLLIVIKNKKKSRREFLIDVIIVVALQISVLAYGLWSIYQIRPIYIVFETDRLRMLNTTEIDPADLAKAPNDLIQQSLMGPKLISTRVPKDGEEMLRSIELSIAGKEPSVRPEMWEEYTPAKEKVRAASRALPELLAVYPDKQAEITRLAEKFDVPYASVIWLPLTSVRSMDWIALIDSRNMEPFTYLPGDGFIPRK